MIIVIGDIMLDAYIFGTSERVSSEAPVPILDVSGSSTYLGGAGNVAYILSELDCETALIGVLGDDEEANIIKSHLFNRCGDLTVKDQCRATTVKTRFISMGQQVLRADKEQTNNIDTTTSAEILYNFIETIGSNNVSCVILSDYAKGVLTASLIRDIKGLCKEKNIPILVDPKGDNWHKYRYNNTMVVTPNKKELLSVSKLILDKKKLEQDEMYNRTGAIQEVSEKIMTELNIQEMLVTLGSNGLLLCIQSNTGQVEFNHFQAVERNIETKNTVGCGDMVTAVYAWANFEKGLGPQKSAQIANALAGESTVKVHTYVDKTVLSELLQL